MELKQLEKHGWNVTAIGINRTFMELKLHAADQLELSGSY